MLHNTGLNLVILTISDSSIYSHYVFNAFDIDRKGAISFEVSSLFKVTLIQYNNTSAAVNCRTHIIKLT